LGSKAIRRHQDHPHISGDNRNPLHVALIDMLSLPGEREGEKRQDRKQGNELPRTKHIAPRIMSKQTLRIEICEDPNIFSHFPWYAILRSVLIALF
jgi:hypothetical protein